MFKNILKSLLVFLLLFVVVGCTVPGGGTTGGNNQGGNQNQNPFEDNYDYKTPETDKLKLTEDYKGKDFIQDGIGEVTISQFVDGDTANFRTKNGKNFTARFLGVNTPESTYKVEPWGFAASKHTKNALKNAYKIVLQCDDINDRVDSTGERYLSWVWLIDENGDSRLLNLELVELALAKAKANDTSLADVFVKAVYDVTMARCRIYGYENDPDYDYSKESQAMSLKEIRNLYGTKEAAQTEADKGKKIVVSGVVVRKDGTNNCYIQQYDVESNQYYGVYVYGGYVNQPGFNVGNSVVIEGKIGYYFGCLQITDINVKVRAFAPEDPSTTYYVEKIDDKSVINVNNGDLIGSLVTIENLTITGGSNSDTNAFTIYTSYVDSEGKTQKLDIRVSNNVNLVGPDGTRITKYDYFVGKTIKSITANVSYYDYNTDDTKEGYIQMMLSSFKDIVLE